MSGYKLYINDIIELIEKIQRYIKSIDFEIFKNDSKTYDSVIHNLFVIGEAASKIPEEFQNQFVDIDLRGIIGMRTVIAH